MLSELYAITETSHIIKIKRAFAYFLWGEVCWDPCAEYVVFQLAYSEMSPKFLTRISGYFGHIFLFLFLSCLF